MQKKSCATSLPESICNLNLFATLAVAYISLITAVYKDSIFLSELKECSERIYRMLQFILYVLGYAIELMLTLFDYIKIVDSGT